MWTQLRVMGHLLRWNTFMLKTTAPKQAIQLVVSFKFVALTYEQANSHFCGS